MEYNIFYISENCNLDCKYCYEKNKKNPSMMSWDEFLKQLKKVKKGDKLILYGGEPTLNWGLIEKICKNNITKDYFTSITTNGTLIDREKLKFLIDNDIEVALSFDGKRTTDKYRKEGITTKIFSLLQYCLDNKIINKITLSWVVHKENIDDLAQDIHEIITKYPSIIKKIHLRPLDRNLKNKIIESCNYNFICHSFCETCSNQECKATIKPYRYFKKNKIICSETSGIIGDFFHFD